ncbi:MAG TPA: hypothetical protein VGF99_15310, partial [Myxococcota bacterium]
MNTKIRRGHPAHPEEARSATKPKAAFSSSSIKHLIAAAVVVSAGSGCATITMTPPERFLVVEEECDSLKAMTPEESKIHVRDFDDDTRGSLTFWRDAVKADLMKQRGYLLLDESAVKDGLGNEGIALTMESTIGGRTVKELLAVFIIEGWFSNTIRVAEFVADKE